MEQHRERAPESHRSARQMAGHYKFIVSRLIGSRVSQLHLKPNITCPDSQKIARILQEPKGVVDRT